jgi:predicted Holliday junction resolvase-like endonuclease
MNVLYVLTLIIIVLLAVIIILITQMHTQAKKQYLTWRERDFESLRTEQMITARKAAMAELELWKIDSEAWIRQDAITRSQAVNWGKISENLVPYMPFFPYNPKEVRFVGSPIDLIVLDGLDENDLRDIIFLEVKTGSSSLSSRQRQIRDAILAGRVLWRELKIK